MAPPYCSRHSQTRWTNFRGPRPRRQAFLAKCALHNILRGDTGMVCTSAHNVLYPACMPSYQNILNGCIQGMSHVQHASDVRRGMTIVYGLPPRVCRHGAPLLNAGTKALLPHAHHNFNQFRHGNYSFYPKRQLQGARPHWLIGRTGGANHAAVRGRTGSASRTGSWMNRIDTGSGHCLRLHPSSFILPFLLHP